MAEWWSVEVLHGEFRASQWQQAYSEPLIESAISHGASDWSWTEHPHGVVFEVCFAADAQWEAFRALPAVRAALDAVPDPVNGLLIYRGRGGGAGAPSPRRPGPAAGAGAMELPEPHPEAALDLTGIRPPDMAPAGPGRGPCAAQPYRMSEGPETVQDGKMADTRAAGGDMISAIERSGYYPGLVADAVSSAVGSEPVASFIVHHDAHFDPGMEVRRHMTVLALTPTRLVFSHTDEYPADETEPDARPQAETSTEAVRFSRISSVAVTRVIPDPASYLPRVTMPSEVVLTIGWNALSHIELEPAHCGDESCEADHGYTGTMTADDLTLRVSEAADGEAAVRQVLAFAQALAAATGNP